MLEPVRKQLAKEQCKLEDSHIVHPKVRRMTHMIQNLIDCDAGYKVIILIKRYFHAAYSLLEDSLKAAKHVRLQKYPMDISDEAFIEKSFHGSNIVFAEVSEELQFCPWTYFDFVFEYEYREDSQWYKLCYKENPKLKGFYSFKVETNASSSQDLPDIKGETCARA